MSTVCINTVAADWDAQAGLERQGGSLTMALPDNDVAFMLKGVCVFVSLATAIITMMETASAVYTVSWEHQVILCEVIVIC